MPATPRIRPGDDGVVEGPERGSEPSAEHVLDRLDREAGDQGLLDVGDEDLGRVAPPVVVGGPLDAGPSPRRGPRPRRRRGGGRRWFGHLGRRDYLGVIGGRDLGQARHAALHVDDEHLDGSGDDRQLLLEEIAGHRDAVAHQDLVGGAAYAGQGDALRARLPGVALDLGSWAATASISERAGSWPWTRMFTVLAPSTPRLTSDRMGFGVPKRMSEVIEATREPPSRRPRRS